MRHYRLISSPESIASGKMRLYLRWRNIPVREVAATRIVLKSEVVPRLKRVDIPVLITPSNETVQDSRSMIDYLERREPGMKLVPETDRGRFASRLLEMLADDWLSPSASYVIWTGEGSRAATSMASMLYPEHDEKETSRVARMLDAQVRAKLGRQGLLQKTWPEREARIKEFVTLLDKRLSGQRFLLGNDPSVADCAIAACLTAMWAESAFGRELAATAPSVTSWLHVMSAGSNLGGVGDIKGHKDKTLEPLLRFAAEQVLPHALGASEALADWADSHPGKINLPRSVGSSSAKRDALGVSRDFTPTNVWMLQRLSETLDQDEDERPEDFSDLLEASGCDMLDRYTARREIRHEHHRFRLNIQDDDGESPVNVHELAEPLMRARKASVETRDLDRLVLS